MIAGVIRDLGPEASSAQVQREVADRCGTSLLRVPDRSTVYYRFIEARAAMPPTAAPALAIDHSALALPVVSSAGVQLPVFSAVLALHSGRIVAHELTLEPPSARSAARLLARAVAATAVDDQIVPLHVGAPKGDDWDDLLRVLLGHGVTLREGPTRSLRPGHFLTRAFGVALGRIKFRPRIATRPTDVPIRPLGRGGVPLSLAEANEVVTAIVSDLNASKTPNELRIVGGNSAAELAASLQEIAFA